MDERAVASKTVTLELPAEAVREYRGEHQYEAAQDALGNEYFRKHLAIACVEQMAEELTEGGRISVNPDGSLEVAEVSE